jgi:hypothetical protein
VRRSSGRWPTAATFETHLNRAMARQHLTSRAQAVVLAYETGLVVPNNGCQITSEMKPEASNHTMSNNSSGISAWPAIAMTM